MRNAKRATGLTFAFKLLHRSQNTEVKIQKSKFQSKKSLKTKYNARNLLKFSILQTEIRNTE